MSKLLSIFSLIVSFKLYAYSPLVATPSCWDASKCKLEDQIFAVHCPTLKKGKGYCNENFNESYRIHFPSDADPAEDYKIVFVPNFKFSNSEGKVVYEYNDKGVFYNGKQVCKVTPSDAIPYIDENKPCPFFFDGPVRYLSSRSNNSAGALLVLDKYQDGKGWVKFKGQELSIPVSNKIGKEESIIKYSSKKLTVKRRGNDQELNKFIVSKENELKSVGAKDFLQKLGEDFLIRSDPDYGEFTKEDVSKWYKASLFFRNIVKECIAAPISKRSRKVKSFTSVASNKMHLRSRIIFSFKEQKQPYPFVISCKYLRKKILKKRKWTLKVYLGPVIGDGFTIDPDPWVY